MKHGAWIVFVLVVGIGAVAQTQAPPPPVSGSLQDQPTTQTYEPSNRPLSGVQNQDIGTPSESRNTFVPSFSVSEGWDSNAHRITTTDSGTSSGITTLSLGLQLNKENAGHATNLGYTGGGQIYTLDSDLNSQFHRLDFTQNFLAGRWSFLLADSFTYQKDAFASSPALLFPGLIGPTGPGLHPGVGPGESIVGQNVGRINNSSTGQLTYGFSRVTTLTSSVSYGVLHYFDNTDFLNTRQLSAGTGLDHRFGRNTIGLNYNFGAFSYENLPLKFDTHTVQAMFSHVLTGRWSFEAGGGPSIIATDYAIFKSTKVYGSGRVAMHYHVPNTDFSAQYERSITGGSGVLPGAITDNLGVATTRKLSRSMSVNLSGGYARNAGTFVDSRFNSFYVGTGLSQAVGRYATVSFGYTGQFQTGNSVSDLSRHAVLVSFNWSFRPIVLH